MVKSNTSIPKFLDSTTARSLNNHIYKNTGCFLFLTIPENNLLSPQPVNVGGDNYRFNILNLYKMYNDYGHFFFWFCIQKSQLPPLTASCDAGMVSEISMLAQDWVRIAKHYAFISKTARHIMAHGIFQISSISYVDPKIKEMQDIFDNILSGKDWPDSEQDWKKITQWITNEANYLYDWLQKWGTLWGKYTTEKGDLQQRFYYGRWEYSINKDSCLSSGPETINFSFPYDGVSIPIYEGSDNNLTSFAKVFASQMVYDAKYYLAAAAGNCVRSQYEEGGKIWTSDKPEVNWRILYKNINFSGIENVRKNMLHPKGSTNVCPDGFRLYLAGLTTKVTELPRTVVQAKSKISRFKRK